VLGLTEHLAFFLDSAVQSGMYSSHLISARLKIARDRNTWEGGDRKRRRYIKYPTVELWLETYGSHISQEIPSHPSVTAGKKVHE